MMLSTFGVIIMILLLCLKSKVKITVISVKGEYVETVHEVVPVSGAKVDLTDDRIVFCHTGDHYRAVVPPVASIKKDTELLQKIAKYISDVNSVPLAQASLHLYPRLFNSC